MSTKAGQPQSQSQALDGMGQRFRGGLAVPTAPIARNDLDPGMVGQPSLHGGDLAVGQQRYGAAPFQVADDAAVTVVAAKRPIIHPDNMVDDAVQPCRPPRPLGKHAGAEALGEDLLAAATVRAAESVRDEVKADTAPGAGQVGHASDVAAVDPPREATAARARRIGRDRSGDDEYGIAPDLNSQARLRLLVISGYTADQNEEPMAPMVSARSLAADELERMTAPLICGKSGRRRGWRGRGVDRLDDPDDGVVTSARCSSCRPLQRSGRGGGRGRRRTPDRLEPGQQHEAVPGFTPPTRRGLTRRGVLADCELASRGELIFGCRETSPEVHGVAETVSICQDEFSMQPRMSRCGPYTPVRCA